MGQDMMIEQFFLENFNIERLFGLVDQYDYLFLYHIRRIAAETEGGQTVYLSALADEMGFSVAQTSKVIQNLQDKGLVNWRTDYEKSRTYVEPSGKALDLMEQQRQRLENVYGKIMQEIPGEDMAKMLEVLRRVMKIIKEDSRQAEENGNR